MSAAFATMSRFLTFRASREELQNLSWSHLAVGFFFVWLAGVARNWDNPKAEFLQHLGVGSLVYVFALATLMTLILAPFFRERDWTVYRRALTVICLTAPPALFYAIPVEMWMSASAARTANYSLLAIVATWRVALWMFYLRRGASFSWPRVLACTLLALSVIVGIVGLFGVLANVGDIMGGVRNPVQAQSERVASALFGIAFFSFLPLLIFYMTLATKAAQERRNLESREILEQIED